VASNPSDPKVAERFARVTSAPAARGRFTPKDLQWILTHAPSETIILRPDPHLSSEPDDELRYGTLRRFIDGTSPLAHTITGT
jgi:hypothetical protein